MNHFLRTSGAVLIVCLAFVAGCDIIGSDDENTGPVAFLQYQTFSHYEGARDVAVGDTTFPTSTTSRVNLVVNGDTAARSIPVTRSTGNLRMKAGRPLSVEVRSFPANDLLAGAELTLEAEASYRMFTFGYAGDIQPVLLRQEPSEEAATDEDGLPPLTGMASLRFLHGAPTTGAVDIYVNRPAAVHSLEPSLTELDPVFADVAYLNFTEAVTYEVSQDPQEEVGSTLHVRVTPAGDASAVLVDTEPDFGAESEQYFVLFDRDKHAEDDSLDVNLGRKAGDATIVDF